MKSLLAWAQLIRAANLPGAAANVLVGWLLVCGEWASAAQVATAVVASLLLYVAGAIGNDLVDQVRDRERNPGRPLPSGRIHPVAARWVMWLSAAGALGCGVWMMRSFSGHGQFLRPLGIIAGLLGCIAVYNWLLKRWAGSALFMGLCRGLNLLLGAAAALESGCPVLGPEAPGLFGRLGLGAAAITLFVCGITLVARDEWLERPRRGTILAGLVLEIMGLAGYALLPWAMLADGIGPVGQAGRNHVLLVVLIGLTILRRGVIALMSGDPSAIRAAVILSLASLLTLDAATALLVSGRMFEPMIILSLLALAMLLRQVASPT